MNLLTKIKENHSDLLVIMTTETSTLDTAIKSVKEGAYDYVTKPFNLDDVVHRIRRAMEITRLEVEFRDYQRLLERKIEEQADKKIRDAFLRAISAIYFALEAKDTYTAGHSLRVCETATAIGKKLALSDDELEDLRLGSSLHDIGKIAVNPLIANKPAKLTAEEYEHVMTHPVVGASIVGTVVKDKRIIEVIEYHHDHYDGTGLNQKHKGEDIPLLARIVAVADAYDAMTSTRPHRMAWSRQQAQAEIKWQIGRQFDPLVVNTFLEMSADMMPQKKKILIADDEESIRLLVRSALSNNYTVIEVVDGQEALEAVQNQEPALIFLDIFMPKKDGLDVCCEIKDNLSTKAIPVVMLTAINHEVESKISAELGADDCIAKPFSPEDLIEVANHFLAENKREQLEILPLAAANDPIS